MSSVNISAIKKCRLKHFSDGIFNPLALLCGRFRSGHSILPYLHRSNIPPAERNQSGSPVMFLKAVYPNVPQPSRKALPRTRESRQTKYRYKKGKLRR
ncbi:hypothetical protein [Neisseria polysaccharea]|uniref:hypothetical protein n=1 Tax=Neisseria polysaccharea TaxID=489 RepID=UPI000300F6F3